jgi:hypothetical protein
MHESSKSVGDGEDGLGFFFQLMFFPVLQGMESRLQGAVGSMRLE